ncbi:MAG: hypothetical protein P8M22_08195 [Phycisphaerales bacterium]|nr:hypothetical protein [Phycisphaerales bacterium]
MGLLDDAIGDAVMLGGQMAYFKIKNNQRAKAFTKWSKAHDFTFCAKPAEYNGEIMQMPTADPDAAKARGGHALSAKASMAHRFFGDSQMQTKLWAFCSNRFRGDWQTNANILEGKWQGTLMTAFDTLWFDLGSPSSEGEYSSVFAHCSAKLPRVIITPSGFLSSLKRLDEGQMANWGYHKLRFELDTFNKNWHVSSADEKLTYDFISQNMMEYLLEHHNEKWHLEISEGGILISTVFTLKPTKAELAMDFLAGFLEHVDEDLLQTKVAT